MKFFDSVKIHFIKLEYNGLIMMGVYSTFQFILVVVAGVRGWGTYYDWPLLPPSGSYGQRRDWVGVPPWHLGE